MKNLLRSMSLLCVLGSGAAVAQSYPGAVNDAISPANFSYTLNLQDRFAVSDTTQGSSVENFSQIARFGLNYNYKRIGSTILVQYDGGTSAGTSSSTSIRKANVTYDIIKSNGHNLKVGIGREHLTASTIYAPDAFQCLYGTNISNQNTGQDGIDLYYTNKSDFAKVTVGAGVFNTVGVRTFSSNGYLAYTSPLVLTNSGTTYNKASYNNGLAYVLQAKGEVPVGQGNIVANALYSMQDNAPMETTALAKRDINYLEASLGYELSNKTGQIGAWYQTETFSSAQMQSGSTTQAAGSNQSYVNIRGSTSSTQNVYGIGFNSNSAFFDKSDFTGDGVGDVATFGLAYEHFDNVLNLNSYAPTGTFPAFSDPFSATTTKSSNIDGVNASVGYKYSTLNFALNYVYMASNDSVFYGTDVNSASLATNASLVYLTGTVSL